MPLRIPRNPAPGLAVALSLLLCACTTTTDPAGVSGVDGSATGDSLSDDDAEPGADGPDAVDRTTINPCEPGHVEGYASTCLPVGPQNCHDAFVDPASGLCMPSMAACEPGTIPVLASGCEAIGPACPAAHVDPDSGFCLPSVDACPGSQVPLFGGAYSEPDRWEPSTCLDLDVDWDTGEGCGAADPWGSVEPLQGDQHVLPGAEVVSANGSREHPWPSVTAAILAVAPGGRVVLGKGEHTEGLGIAQPLTVVGACPSEVLVTGTVATPGGPAHVHVAGALGVTLRGLTLTGPGVGVVASGGAGVVLERVVVRDASIVGVVATQPGTEVQATGLLVDSTAPFETDGTLGMGVQVAGGARMVLHSAALSGNHDVAIGVWDTGSRFEASGLLVEGTQPESSSGAYGYGLYAQGSVQLSLDGAVLRDNHGAGMTIFDPGTVLEGTDVIVAGTRARAADGMGGHGVVVDDGARLTLSRSVVTANRELGLSVMDDGSGLVVDHVLVQGTLPRAGTGLHGRAVQASQAASLSLSDVALHDNHEDGLAVFGAGTTVTATGLLVEGTRAPPGDPRFGWGVVVEAGAALMLDGAVVRDNHAAGVHVSGADSSIAAARVLIHGTARGASDFGHGMVVGAGANADLVSVAVHESDAVGVLASGSGTTITGADLSVHGPDDATHGDAGIWLQAGASAVLAGVSIASARAAAFGLVTGAAVELMDARLAHTGVGDVTAFEGVGDGLSAHSATLLLERVDSVGNARAGFALRDCSGSLSELTSRDNDMGFFSAGDPQPEVVGTIGMAGNASEGSPTGELDVLNGELDVPTAGGSVD